MNDLDMTRIPLNGTFELTARCNLKCKMCLIRLDNSTMEKLDIRERSTKEWIGMAEQVREAGTLGLLLTGGEAMIRPDFVDIYSELISMGFIMTVYTNATSITRDINRIFNKYPPHNIGITVYGASRKTYGLVTGSEDAYDRMLTGVELLRQLPSRLTIRSTIINDNREDLNKIASWASSFGQEVNFNVSRIVTKPVRGGLADVEGCRLSPEQNVHMLKELYREKIIKPLLTLLKDQTEITQDKEFLNILTDKKEECRNKRINESVNKPTLYGCDAGINSYTITCDGRLVGCQLLNDCCTYPFIDGFLQAWESFPSKVRHLPAPDKCRGCSTPCTACYATRLSETGSIAGWPEYLCREAILKEKMEEDLLAEINAGLTSLS